jgi:hypothetical protein
MDGAFVRVNGPAVVSLVDVDVDVSTLWGVRCAFNLRAGPF